MNLDVNIKDETAKKKIKKRAFILGLLLFLLLAVSLVWIVKEKTADQGDYLYAYIYRDQELLYQIDLNDVKEPYTLKIQGEDGAYNLVEVRSGSIGIKEASCPDKLCVKMGYLDNSLMPITCLPNHLVIRVEEGQKEMDSQEIQMDGLVY